MGGIDQAAQARAAAIPRRGICQEKLRLQEELLQVVDEALALHRQQANAIRSGDREFSRFDPLIHIASEKKRKAKYELMAHTASHGC